MSICVEFVHQMKPAQHSVKPAQNLMNKFNKN